MAFADDLNQLGAIAAEAASEEQWQQLALYFQHRSVGRRKDALLALEGFLAHAAAWPLDERLRVTRWIADRRSRLFNDTGLLPQPLLLRLISPTLWEWVELEPASAEAHFLTATVAISLSDSKFAHKPFHLRRAIALDPAHDEARVALVEWLTSDAEYNQHELPGCYLGDAEADIQELQEAEDVADEIAHPLRRESQRAEVVRLREIASAWLAFRQSGQINFSDWCAEHGVDLGTTH